MKVTREHKSGVNEAVGSLVTINIVKVGEKSISKSPTRIKTLPPVLYVSLFKTELTTGSTFSTSYTINGHPNLKELSRVLMNESSAKEVFIMFFSPCSASRNSVAYPLGSTINGYLLNLCKIMAFSMQRLSTGKLCACHSNL